MSLEEIMFSAGIDDERLMLLSQIWITTVIRSGIECLQAAIFPSSEGNRNPQEE